MIAARKIADVLGWPVFPVHSVTPDRLGKLRCSCSHGHNCRQPGKHPRIDGGFLNATRHAGIIESWFANWPLSNIGVPTGALPDFIVLDIDAHKGGEVSLEAWETQHGLLPETVQQLTGGGGRHLFFRHPGGTIKNAVDLAPGLDVRGDGGYIVVAPSRHISGRFYAWEAQHDPMDIGIAAAPAWLLERMQRGSTKRLRRDGAPLVLVDGNRNDLLFRLACADRRYGLSAQCLFERLQVANRGHCTPPLDDRELRKIARSAASYAPAAEAPG